MTEDKAVLIDLKKSLNASIELGIKLLNNWTREDVWMSAVADCAFESGQSSPIRATFCVSHVCETIPGLVEARRIRRKVDRDGVAWLVSPHSYQKPNWSDPR